MVAGVRNKKGRVAYLVNVLDCKFKKMGSIPITTFKMTKKTNSLIIRYGISVL